MMNCMKVLGPCRRSFALSGPPPATFKAKTGRSGFVPVFEPYEEELPLQSGYYTFVIDEHGRFLVLRSNTSSHASFVNGGRVASAGSFRIERMGKLAEVLCTLAHYDEVESEWYSRSRPPGVVSIFTTNDFAANGLGMRACFARSKTAGAAIVSVSWNASPISPERCCWQRRCGADRPRRQNTPIGKAVYHLNG
jgi:hypothetical protein